MGNVAVGLSRFYKDYVFMLLCFTNANKVVQGQHLNITNVQ